VAGAARRVFSEYGTMAAPGGAAAAAAAAGEAAGMAKLPPRWHLLLKQARARGVNLRLQPRGMHRHSENTSCWFPTRKAQTRASKGVAGEQAGDTVGSKRRRTETVAASVRDAGADDNTAAEKDSSCELPSVKRTRLHACADSPCPADSLPGLAPPCASDAGADAAASADSPNGMTGAQHSDEDLDEGSGSDDDEDGDASEDLFPAATLSPEELAAGIVVHNDGNHSIAAESDDSVEEADACGFDDTSVADSNVVEDTAAPALVATFATHADVGSGSSLPDGLQLPAAPEPVSTGPMHSQSRRDDRGPADAVEGRLYWRVELEFPHADPPMTLAVPCVPDTATVADVFRAILVSSKQLLQVKPDTADPASQRDVLGHWLRDAEEGLQGSLPARGPAASGSTVTADAAEKSRLQASLSYLCGVRDSSLLRHQLRRYHVAVSEPEPATGEDELHCDGMDALRVFLRHPFAQQGRAAFVPATSVKRAPRFRMQPPGAPRLAERPHEPTALAGSCAAAPPLPVRPPSPKAEPAALHAHAEPVPELELEGNSSLAAPSSIGVLAPAMSHEEASPRALTYSAVTLRDLLRGRTILEFPTLTVALPASLVDAASVGDALSSAGHGAGGDPGVSAAAYPGDEEFPLLIEQDRRSFGGQRAPSARGRGSWGANASGRGGRFQTPSRGGRAGFRGSRGRGGGFRGRSDGTHRSGGRGGAR